MSDLVIAGLLLLMYLCGVGTGALVERRAQKWRWQIQYPPQADTAEREG